MKTWLTYLKQGLSRRMPGDRLAEDTANKATAANIKNLYPYLKRHWRSGMFGILLIAAGALFAFPSPLITRYLVDEVIMDRRMELLVGAILLLAGCLVGEKVSRVLGDFYFARVEQQIMLDIQHDLIDRVLHFPQSFFDDNQTGYIQSRLTEDVEGLRWFFSSTIVHVISSCLRFLGGVIFLLYLEWKLSVAVFILLPGLVWFIRFFSTRLHILSHHSMEQKADVSGHIQESLSEALLIKAYAAEDRTRKRLISSLQKVFKVTLEQATLNSFANMLIQSMPGFARVFALAVGAVWIIQDRWTLGSLLAFQAYLAYVFGPAQLLASANLQLQEALASLARVSKLFDIVPEANLQTGQRVSGLNGEIEFNTVSFSYNGGEPVLKDVCFHIHPGERVAIVGPSGAGKTTLLSLILHLYIPTSGEILFDGSRASDYEAGSLRKRIGYVPQQPRLLTDTLFENLRYGNPEADVAKVHLCAKIAGIHEFIERLPDGYQTKFGTDGIRLSEGQKQRITIARALIKDPDILVFDEPTAALDSDTERSIFKELSKQLKDKTLLVASHRPSIIKDANRVLLLNEKQVLASGTHHSLLESNDHHKRSFLSVPGVQEANRR